MLVDVKTEYHTFGYRLSLLLCGLLLNRVERLRAIDVKSRFNRPIGSRDLKAILSHFFAMHNSSRNERCFFLASEYSDNFLNLNKRSEVSTSSS